MACVLLKSVSWFAILKYCLGLPVVRFRLLDLARHIQFTKVYINRFINIYIYIHTLIRYSLWVSIYVWFAWMCPTVSSCVLPCPPLSPNVPGCVLVSSHVPALLGHMSPRVPAGPAMSPHCWDTCPRVSPQVLACPRTCWDTCPSMSLRVPWCPLMSPAVPRNPSKYHLFKCGYGTHIAGNRAVHAKPF